MSKSLYFIVDGYDDILDCLDRKKSINYLNKLSKEECIEEIGVYIDGNSKINSTRLETILSKDIQKNDPNLIRIIKNINKWEFGSEGSTTRYNLMSYARLIDYIPLNLIENKTQKEFNLTFDKLIERHIKGLLFIEKSIEKN
ncbi:MAG: hypothetical protein KAH04_01685 [Psychrilyobacter sp.]|nr:hypothetical protein [Psychrilyobacter sp.]